MNVIGHFLANSDLEGARNLSNKEGIDRHILVSVSSMTVWLVSPSSLSVAVSLSLQVIFLLALAMKSATDMWHQRVHGNRMVTVCQSLGPTFYTTTMVTVPIIPGLFTIIPALFLIPLQYQLFPK